MKKTQKVFIKKMLSSNNVYLTEEGRKLVLKLSLEEKKHVPANSENG
jgi:hypothetical protein